ncbi:unnamed protein product [Mucor hiemalis]
MDYNIFYRQREKERVLGACVNGAWNAYYKHLRNGKRSFETVETNFRRNISVTSYAGKMAEYLDDENGIDEFLAAQHKKKMKRLNNQEKHSKERVQKKLRIEMLQEIETQNDHLSSSYVPSPQIPKSKQYEHLVLRAHSPQNYKNHKKK